MNFYLIKNQEPESQGFGFQIKMEMLNSNRVPEFTAVPVNLF